MMCEIEWDVYASQYYALWHDICIIIFTKPPFAQAFAHISIDCDLVERHCVVVARMDERRTFEQMGQLN